MVNREVWYAGPLAGIIAGVGMALVAIFISAAYGNPALLPVELIAATFYGDRALNGGLDVIAVGVLTHLVVSIFWSTIFTYLISDDTSPLEAFWEGLAYGVIVWLVMTFVALPMVNPVMYSRIAEMKGPFFVEHLAYGGLLFTASLLRKAFRKRLAVEETSKDRKVA